MARLFYQGHGSFRIVTNNNTVIYFDPFEGDGYDLPADLILITHDHYDHNRIDLIKNKKPNCVIIDQDQALKDGRHNSFEHFGVKIEAVMAENKNHDPKKCVGYILELDGVKLYASGDTSKTAQMEEFKERKLDYALLCCDGIYNMDTEEASECAKIIGARVSIPIHTAPQKRFDIEIAKRFKANGVKLLEDGQEIEL